MPMELDVKKTVKKSNVLNELRNANTTMAEYRLFCVYLAHLPMNTEDNKVVFSLAEYARISGLDRPRYIDIKEQAQNIVGTTATLPNEDGGFSVYSLFLDFKLYKEDEQWMVSLECNPKLAPMIREQRGRFLRYKLYNTIYLKSYNQQRIYELLKQYEKIGERIIDLQDLREFLSVSKDEYPVWGVFARDVLKVAQRALKKNTDICFDFEPVKKGRKVTAVKFIIKSNDGYVDQLHIDDFLPPTEIECEDGREFEVIAAQPYDPVLFRGPEHEYSEPYLRFLAEACDYEFDEPDMREIQLLLKDKVPSVISLSVSDNQLRNYEFLQKAYAALNAQAKRDDIADRFKYIKGILRNMPALNTED